MVAPATCPGVLRARIRLCRVLRHAPARFVEGRGGTRVRAGWHRDFCEVAIAENNTIGSAGGFRCGARRWNCLRRAWRRVMSRRLRRRLGPIRSCRHRRLRGRARGRCEHAEAPVDRPGEGQDRLAGRQDAGATAGLGGCSMRPFAWVRARSLHAGRAPGTLHRNTPQGRASARLRATCGYARSPPRAATSH